MSTGRSFRFDTAVGTAKNKAREVRHDLPGSFVRGACRLPGALSPGAWFSIVRRRGCFGLRADLLSPCGERRQRHTRRGGTPSEGVSPSPGPHPFPRRPTGGLRAPYWKPPGVHAASASVSSGCCVSYLFSTGFSGCCALSYAPIPAVLLRLTRLVAPHQSPRPAPREAERKKYRHAKFRMAIRIRLKPLQAPSTRSLGESKGAAAPLA